MNFQKSETVIKVNKPSSSERSFKRMISSIDNFGCPVQLLVKRSDKHTTFYGGCFTLLISLITIFYLSTEIIQLVNRSSPIIQTSDYYTEQPEKIILSPEQFNMVFFMQQLQGYKYITYRDRTIFDVNFLKCTKTTFHDPVTNEQYPYQNCENIPHEPCDIDKHFKISSLRNQYLDQNISNMYCIGEKAQMTNPPSLEGNWDADPYQWLEIDVNKCVNVTGVYESCAPQEEIDRRLNGGYGAVYYSDVINDPFNKYNPYSYIWRNAHTIFSNILNKQISLYMRHVSTESNDGYILNEKKNYKQLQYSYTEEIISTGQGVFLSFLFRLEQKKTGQLQSYWIVAYRSYLKIQDILGAVGGLWSILILIGMILVYPINKLDLKIRILNSVFAFEEQSPKEPKLPKMESNLGSTNNASQSQQKSAVQINYGVGSESFALSNETPLANYHNALNQFGEDHIVEVKDKQIRSTNHHLTRKVYTQIQAFKEERISIASNPQINTPIQSKLMANQIKDYFKINMSKLKLKTFEYIFFFFHFFKNDDSKQDQINFGLKKLDKQIDVLYVIKKLTELEKLKMLILSPQQQQLFDYLPKPSIPNKRKGSSEQEKIENLIQNDEDNQMRFEKFSHDRKTMILRASEAFDAYQFIQSKPMRTQIDEKLIKFLEPRIKRVFDMGLEEQLQKQQQDHVSQPSIQKIENDMEIFQQSRSIGDEMVIIDKNNQFNDQIDAKDSNRVGIKSIQND